MSVFFLSGVCCFEAAHFFWIAKGCRRGISLKKSFIFLWCTNYLLLHHVLRLSKIVIINFLQHVQYLIIMQLILHLKEMGAKFIVINLSNSSSVTWYHVLVVLIHFCLICLVNDLGPLRELYKWHVEKPRILRIKTFTFYKKAKNFLKVAVSSGLILDICFITFLYETLITCAGLHSVSPTNSWRLHIQHHIASEAFYQLFWFSKSVFNSLSKSAMRVVNLLLYNFTKYWPKLFEIKRVTMKLYFSNY